MVKETDFLLMLNAILTQSFPGNHMNNYNTNQAIPVSHSSENWNASEILGFL